jgi:hypothetical protein
MRKRTGARCASPTGKAVARSPVQILDVHDFKQPAAEAAEIPRRARLAARAVSSAEGSAHSARQGTNGKGQTARVARKRANPAAVLSILPLNPGHFALLPFGGGSGWPAAAYPGFLNPGSGCFAARCWEPPFATHERPQSLSRFHGCAAAVRANEYERIEVIGSSRSCEHRKHAGRALVPQNR